MIVRASVLSTLCATLIACGGGGGEPTTPTPQGNDTPVATTITVSPNAFTATSLGQTSTLVAEVKDQKGRQMSGTVNWSSSNASVASVSSSGVVTTTGSGSADITASFGGLTASSRITVTRAVASVVVTPGTVNLTSLGATLPLQAVARDASGADIQGVTFSWMSTDPTIATVSSNGMVTAVKNGAAMIRVTTGPVSGTAAVAVNAQTTPAACTSDPVFTNDLIAPDKVKVITQIGVVGGANTAIVGRSYVMTNDGIDGVRVPLTAPTGLKVAGAKHYVPMGAPQGYTPDWSLLIDLGCGITMELYHVKDVAASIKAVADTTIYSSSAWQQLPQPVNFAAGDTFGWYVRGLNSVAFDVIAHDSRKVNRFANQQRYESGRSNLLDIVCPWSFFTPSKRDTYLGMIGAPTGVRFPGAGCGSVERDVAGTPAGQWFLSPTVTSTFPFGKEGDYGDPLPIILGIDNQVYIGHVGPSDDFRVEQSNPTWKDPATITTSWCYQTGPGAGAPNYLWLQMVSATEMKVAFGANASCPASFPSSGFRTYYR